MHEIYYPVRFVYELCNRRCERHHYVDILVPHRPFVFPGNFELARALRDKHNRGEAVSSDVNNNAPPVPLKSTIRKPQKFDETSDDNDDAGMLV